MDVREVTSIRHVLVTVRPDVTFSLAAPPRDAGPAEALGLLPGILTLLEEAQGLVVLAGSAAEYGPRNDPRPLGENAALRPRGPYATAKAMQTVLARGMGGRVAIARLFNLIGPGQPPGFVVSDLITRTLAGERPLRVRDAGSTRDLVDVRDAAAALALVAERDFFGEVNVGWGVPVPIGDVAGVVCDTLGGDWMSERGGRQDDHSAARADILLALGWRPTYDWRSSVTEQARQAARSLGYRGDSRSSR